MPRRSSEGIIWQNISTVIQPVKEKKHDLAVEKYEKESQKYQENATKLHDWIATNARIKDEAKQTLENTDYALKLYNETHRDQKDLKENQFSDFYKASVQQKHEKYYVSRVVRAPPLLQNGRQ